MITSTRRGANDAVGFVQLNRPKKLNALCKQLVRLRRRADDPHAQCSMLMLNAHA
jgi:enoyl-CoA hydratase/carnithine racemase